MAKTSIKKITISQKLATRLSEVLSEYEDLLSMEIESSINDEVIKKDYKKRMCELNKLGKEFNKPTV